MCTDGADLFEVRRLGERLRADGADMRPQSRVHLTVSAQAAGVLEGLATLLTHIWPLACVLPQVVLIVRAPFESERAVRALERPNACMHLGKKRRKYNL